MPEMQILVGPMRNRLTYFVGAAALAAGAFACQAYNLEEVDPQTVVAVETFGTYTKGKPPTLLIVQDRSGSMEICFDPDPTPGSGERCQLADGTPASDRRSRMVVAREVMDHTVSTHQHEVWFGLVAYGVPQGASSCGPPVALADPGAGSGAQVAEAYRSHELIVEPQGGTPTTEALREAYDRLVGADGKPLHGDRENYVVLVTDGLMNCNPGHAMPCLCSQEAGCPPLVGGTPIPFGEEGEFAIPELCLDDATSLAEVRRLRDAGIQTFVIGLGDTFTGGDQLSTQVLDELAEAGGMPRTGHPQKFYSAGDEAELAGALEDIIRQIAAPCTYRLDGPVCDGRLVKVALRIDDERVETSCNQALDGEADWFFVDGAGGRSAQEISFSPALCAKMAAAETVEISIRGVENACPDETTEPACSLAE
jgi:hypothetical protein